MFVSLPMCVHGVFTKERRPFRDIIESVRGIVIEHARNHKGGPYHTYGHGQRDFIVQWEHFHPFSPKPRMPVRVGRHCLGIMIMVVFESPPATLASRKRGGNIERAMWAYKLNGPSSAASARPPAKASLSNS